MPGACIMPWLVASIVAAVAYFACAVLAVRKARAAETDLPPIGEFIEIEGAKIHYVRRGSGRPIVLLHGSDGFLQDFTESIFDALAEHYDTIAFDRPGHGYSDLP